MYRMFLCPLALLVFAGCAVDSPTTAREPLEHQGHAQVAARVGDLGPNALASLAQVRGATAAFHNVEAAMAARYTAWSPDPFAASATCPSSAEGKMGYHLVNVPLRGGAANPAAGDARVDPLEPEMLLYEKRADGQMHLVGVEYIVFTAAWEREHGAGAAPPEVFGQPLLSSVHTFPGNADPIPHYELHVWIWSDNPRGMFYPWNPTVRC
ncbi:MAG: hypothetical protein ACREOK_09520 [Gemmatimonadaceae bacterium]